MPLPQHQRQPVLPLSCIMLKLSFILLVLLQGVSENEAFLPNRIIQVSSQFSFTQLYYKNEKLDNLVAASRPTNTTTATAVAPPSTATTAAIKSTTPSSQKKLVIPNIRSLNELQYFLEEDDRLVAIKFYAPWCKTCQKLNIHFNKLVHEKGDKIIDRKKVYGSLRFAQIEYSKETYHFITERLKVQSIPTLQLYYGLHKLYEITGPKTTKELQHELQSLQDKRELSLINNNHAPFDLETYAEQVDDGILINAIEENYYDQPDFLMEEW